MNLFIELIYCEIFPLGTLILEIYFNLFFELNYNGDLQPFEGGLFFCNLH